MLEGSQLRVGRVSHRFMVLRERIEITGRHKPTFR